MKRSKEDVSHDSREPDLEEVFKRLLLKITELKIIFRHILMRSFAPRF